MGAGQTRCNQCFSKRPPESTAPLQTDDDSCPTHTSTPSPKSRPLGSKVIKAMSRMGNQRPSGGFSSEEGRISMLPEEFDGGLRILPAQVECPGKSWILSGVYEHQALKVGLRHLDEAWGHVGLTNFPTGKDALAKELLFKNLLSGELQLKSIPGVDLVAAQSDLKRLSLVQLLRLRVLLLDFTPSGAGAGGMSTFTFQSSHETFLRMLDGLLFHSLAQKLVKTCSMPVEASTLEVGRDAVLMIGAASAIKTSSWWSWWLPIENSQRVFFDVDRFNVSESFPPVGVLEADKISKVDRNDTTGNLRFMDWRVKYIKSMNELCATPQRCKSGNVADIVSPEALLQGRERLRSKDST